MLTEEIKTLVERTIDEMGYSNARHVLSQKLLLAKNARDPGSIRFTLYELHNALRWIADLDCLSFEGKAFAAEARDLLSPLISRKVA